MRWIATQEAGWKSGKRLSFAILRTGRAVGHVVLKQSGGEAHGEVGYWTGASARGLGVASRAVELLTTWAFDTRTEAGLSRLQLIHNAGNPASCRVAQKAGHTLESILPPRAPHEAEGHCHAHERGAVLTSRVTQQACLSGRLARSATRGGNRASPRGNPQQWPEEPTPGARSESAHHRPAVCGGCGRACPRMDACANAVMYCAP
ncbi:GNAT family N-acetyltransferase [Streptomyces sp. SID9727]|nr:GNAT family N-acetyltransferase [Streptomyces sp. SID9727]